MWQLYICTTLFPSPISLVVANKAVEEPSICFILYVLKTMFITKGQRLTNVQGPFCQVSSSPSSLPQGLRDPPAYSPPPSPQSAHATLTQPPHSDEPPAYSTLNSCTPQYEKGSSDPPAEDVLHFLDPSQDTIPSLSLRYGVPQEALRRKNGLFADHLLAARRTILIPGDFYKGGVSLSPEPIEGEEEEIRRAKVRRWMVACKVAE